MGSQQAIPFVTGWLDGRKQEWLPPPFVNLNLGIGTALTFTPRFGQRSWSARQRCGQVGYIPQSRMNPQLRCRSLQRGSERGSYCHQVGRKEGESLQVARQMGGVQCGCLSPSLTCGVGCYKGQISQWGWGWPGRDSGPCTETKPSVSATWLTDICSPWEGSRDQLAC